MRLLFVTFLLFAFYGTDRVFGQDLQKPSPVPYQAGCIGCVPVVPVMPMAPAVIYQPQVVYQPYQYMGSALYERRYATPFRNALFGRYRGYHYYSPMQVQQ